MFSADVNLFVVLAAAVIDMALGAFWYSPSGFGREWQKLSGITDAKIKKAKKQGMTPLYGSAFIAALVMAYILAHIVEAFNASTVVQGAIVGFWMWLGFVATTMLGIVLWDGKSPKLYAINAGYYFVSFMLMGALLAIWR